MYARARTNIGKDVSEGYSRSQSKNRNKETFLFRILKS